MKQKYVLILFFILVSFTYFSPLIKNIGNWGFYDWDQHFFYHASPRVSLLNYGQIPLWNPHYCGGNPLLANPQSAFLSPIFGLVLMFGAVVGLKLQILAYLMIGLFGTFFAAKQLRSNAIASATAAVIFMLSSWYAARVQIGHTTFFPFALMPWVFFFYLKSENDKKWIVMAALSLAAMFFAGGIYPLYATILMLLVYSLLTSFEKKKVIPIATVFAIFAVFSLLAAVKILPVVEFTANVPVQKDVQLTNLGFMGRALFYPNQGLDENDVWTGRENYPQLSEMEKEQLILEGKIPWGWHEYSGYIGILALLLAFLAAINYKKNWKLLVLALFFVLLAYGDSSPIPIWKVLRFFPFFEALHGPSRFIIPFVFIVALLASRSMSTIKIARRNLVSAVLLAVITFELLFVSFPLLTKAFPVAPLPNLLTDNDEFIQVYSSVSLISQYPNLLQNLGTLNCYERLHLKIRALPQFVDGEPYDGFIGNAYIIETNQTFNYSYFSSNKVRINLDNLEINDTATLVVNQNYYQGWRADNGNLKPYNGLLAAEISKSDKQIEFSFFPKSFIIGSIVSFLSLVSAILIFIKPKLIRKLVFEKGT